MVFHVLRGAKRALPLALLVLFGCSDNIKTLVLEQIVGFASAVASAITTGAVTAITGTG